MQAGFWPACCFLRVENGQFQAASPAYLTGESVGKRVETVVHSSPLQANTATITVDNQARLNVLDMALMAELIDAFRSLEARGDLRSVVLTGAGNRAFIGGADVNEMASLNPGSAREFITRLHIACRVIRNFRVPVIARINGYCLGGGLEVAACCDIRVASEESRFGMPEVKVGVPSVIEAALLPRLIGPGRARLLLYTGEMITAAEAADWGLVDRIAPADGLDAAVEQITSQIASAGPVAVRLQKELVWQWESLSMNDAIKAGIDSFAEAYDTDEPRRLMKEFLERKRRKDS